MHMTDSCWKRGFASVQNNDATNACVCEVYYLSISLIIQMHNF